MRACASSKHASGSSRSAASAARHSSRHRSFVRRRAAPAALSTGRCAPARRRFAPAPRAPRPAPWRFRRSAPRSAAPARRRPDLQRRQPAFGGQGLQCRRDPQVFRASRPRRPDRAQGVAVFDQPVGVFAPDQHFARRRWRHAAGRPDFRASRPVAGRRPRASFGEPPPRRCPFPPAPRRFFRARHRRPPPAPHWRAARRRGGRPRLREFRIFAPCRRCARDRRGRRRRRGAQGDHSSSRRRARCGSSAMLATGPCTSSARSRALAAINCAFALLRLLRAAFSSRADGLENARRRLRCRRRPGLASARNESRSGQAAATDARIFRPARGPRRRRRATARAIRRRDCRPGRRRAAFRAGFRRPDVGAAAAPQRSRRPSPSASARSGWSLMRQQARRHMRGKLFGVLRAWRVRRGGAQVFEAGQAAFSARTCKVCRASRSASSRRGRSAADFS